MIGAATMALEELERGSGSCGGTPHRLPDADREPRRHQRREPSARCAEADLVACEDTRRAGRLYERLELSRPRLVSNHEQNEVERARQLVAADRARLEGRA